MKNEIRLALLGLAAAASVPAFAQNLSPQCGSANFDQARNAFTIKSPVGDIVNQQCYLTVYSSASVPEQARQYPAFFPVEGNYVIELSGGGGGGGGGARKDDGGGGGGAGAAPSRTVKYLSPGVYKLTIGTGGLGGSANGGRTAAGNPTSLTNAHTGQLIAGFQSADVSTGSFRDAGSGKGGVGAPGGSTGGSGGDSGAKSEESAQSGSALATAGYSGTGGSAGTEINRGLQSNAGGGGGAGVGSGGAGESVNANAAAGRGDLGGGGGGGSGGMNTADAGGRGGHGFIRLTMSEPAPRTIAPAPAAAAPTRVMQKYSLSADAMFGFGKSTLQRSGEAKLDELVGKMREINVTSITDTGHADRIGSAETNQRVSESRAESVKAYLVSRGVPADIISVAGMGESQPATGPDDCKGPATAKVIACLQPDRRVDVEVVGTQKLIGMK